MSKHEITQEEMKDTLISMGEKALEASRHLAAMTTAQKNECLLKMAAEVEASEGEIVKANKKDLIAAAAAG